MNKKENKEKNRKMYVIIEKMKISYRNIQKDLINY